jgi:hypothetical protein
MSEQEQTEQTRASDPAVGSSDLLDALEAYNQRHHEGTRGFYTLLLFPDGSGYIMNKQLDFKKQFDDLDQCMEALRG